jgi:hypothetical protein
VIYQNTRRQTMNLEMWDSGSLIFFELWTVSPLFEKFPEYYIINFSKNEKSCTKCFILEELSEKLSGNLQSLLGLRPETDSGLLTPEPYPETRGSYRAPESETSSPLAQGRSTCTAGDLRVFGSRFRIFLGVNEGPVTYLPNR